MPRARQLVSEAIERSGWAEAIAIVVHGDARGIDRAAGDIAAGTWPVRKFPAAWDLHGKSAGPIRNREMANYADALIAIWDGESRGTKNMITTATQCGLKVFVLLICPHSHDIISETI
jgi:hypothetical protein